MSESTTSGGVCDLKVSDELFKDVKYYIIGNTGDQIEKYLSDGGGKQEFYLSQMVTHVVAENGEHEECSEARELFELPVVSMNWVILSVKCGVLLPTNAFSLDSGQVFSGMVACPSQLSEKDSKSVWAMVTFYGGSCQMHLNKKVTHLITVKPSGAKYECAMQHSSKVKVVTPDWVIDSIDKKSKQDEGKYHPKLLILQKPATPEPATPTPEPEIKRESPSIEPEQQLRFTPLQQGTESKRTPSKASGTKEALARMLSNRQQALGLHAPAMPLPAIGASASNGTEATPSRTLRNITNSAEVLQAQNRQPSNKVEQILSSLRTPPSSRPHQGRAQVPVRPPEITLYYGHDQGEQVPPEMCLLGCVFYITDYQKSIDIQTLDSWKRVIDQSGGQVDESYSNRITHVLCQHLRTDVVQLALRERKRVITAYWLNDCLARKKMMPPWLALHLPSPYSDQKPCSNQIIAVTGFEGEERLTIKNMIASIGAKYTGYLSHSNSVLIVKKAAGQKYEKAKEWKVSVVNIQWLNDIMFGQLEALKSPVHARYQQFNTLDEFRIENWKVAHLLEGWKQGLKVSKEAWKRFNPSNLLKQQTSLNNLAGKRKAEDPLLQEAKRARLQTAPPNAPIVLITGMHRDLAQQLEDKVEKLGGYIALKAKECTHLVTSGISRTVKFLTAFPVCRHLVSVQWVLQSFQQGRFLSENEFMLIDREGELEHRCKVYESLQRAHQRPVLKDLTFYLTPSVLPGIAILKEVIENAGGNMVRRRPSVKNILAKKDAQGNPNFIVVSCENDLHLCRDLFARKMAVQNAEFILSAVLRQQLDYKSFTIFSE